MYGTIEFGTLGICVILVFVWNLEFVVCLGFRALDFGFRI